VFSTVDDYLEILMTESESLNYYSGDLYPYIEDPNYTTWKDHLLNYYTGYYSNYPNTKQDLKRIIQSIQFNRKLNSFAITTLY
jgi:hypothetical protein